MIDPGELNVLVPDEFGGVTVCDLQGLIMALAEFETLDDALTDCGFEMSSSWAIVGRVRLLNETGNAAAFWGMDDKSS